MFRQVERPGYPINMDDIQIKPCYVSVPSCTSLFDAADAKKVKPLGYTVGLADNFVRACKKLRLPFEQHKPYKEWLMQTGSNLYGGKITDDLLPMEKNSRGYVEKLPVGWRLPYPSGVKWHKIKAKLWKSEQDDHRLLKALEAEVQWEVSMYKDNARNGEAYCFSAQFHHPKVLNLINTPDVSISNNKFANSVKKKKRKKAALGDGPKPPGSVLQALDAEDNLQWCKSMDEEMFGLTKMRVMMHDLTLDQLRTVHGVSSTPVPVGLYFDLKTDELGAIVRRKSRAAIQGHPGNMQKGIHYDETYSATPQQETSAIMCCLAIRHNLKRKAWDVEKAYCCASIPAGKRIGLRYPEGFKRFSPTTGEELYMLLLKNLYGDPGACKRWSDHRDQKILEHFNEGYWHCQRMLMDPTLFLVKRESGGAASRWMLVSMHSDDFDGAGTDDDILQQFEDEVNTFWTLKAADVNYMLGWQRVPEFDSNVRLTAIELRMTAYIEGMAATFKEFLPDRVDTPYPVKTSVSKDMVVDEKVTKAVHIQGYRRAVGMVLWAARRSFVENKYGVSICGSVMHKANDEAFDNVMWIIKWMLQNKHRGIRFSLDGNLVPIGMSDASNKPVMVSGLCQAGYVIMWMGGPIASESRRLNHVGLSSEHNEYMAICLLVKKIMWFRQLMQELGLGEQWIKLPTEIFADNVQANRLCREHFISPGNQYIATQYHFNKEKVQSGDVIIHYVNTVNNIADIFTKALGRQVVDTILRMLLGYDPDHLKMILKAADIKHTESSTL